MKRDEEARQRELCLNCPYYDCVDCVDRTTMDMAEEFDGVIYTVEHMARVTGRSKQVIRNRMKVGGVGYALSDARNYREYRQRKGATE